MKTVLITGGAGFIGTNTADTYLKKRHRVIIYDNLYRPGVEKNLAWIKKHQHRQNLTIVKADILDQKKLSASVKQANIIFHLAGQTAVTTSVSNPRLDFEFNALGTLNVLEAIRQHNPKAIIVTASTNKVYGNLSRLNISEAKTRYKVTGKQSVSETEPLDFYSPYGCSKGTADQYTRDYHRMYGLHTISFRQSCIYGPHQLGVEDQGWLAHFAASALSDRNITLFGSGKQVRDVLYVDDLVSAYDLAVQNITTTAGQVYNIGGGTKNTVSLLELITLLEKILNRPIITSLSTTRPGDQKVYISDITKATRHFGWRPSVSVADGVNHLVQWLQTSL